MPLEQVIVRVRPQRVAVVEARDKLRTQAG